MRSPHDNTDDSSVPTGKPHESPDHQTTMKRSMFQDAEDLLPTRLSLLGRLKNWEDEESWREFFNTYWKLIYGVAIRAGLNDAEAQDVVQETIITVAKQMPNFNYDPGIGSFKGWLLNITRWRINDQLRKRKRDAAPRKPTHDATTLDTELIESVPDPVGNELDRVWDQEWEKTSSTSPSKTSNPTSAPNTFRSSTSTSSRNGLFARSPARSA
jgi:RNA polymerase sigma-70 factor (ECF subfamily)